CCRAATVTARAPDASATDASATATVMIARAATGRPSRASANGRPPKEKLDEHHCPRQRRRRPRRRPPALLPPAQDLPVLRRQRTEDRFQGREAAAALRLGARQDRPQPDHRGLVQE